ncbi:kinase-like domain-containing protein, partial [Pholiota molesta]
VLPDNLLLWGLQAAQNITPEIAKHPCHIMVEVTGSDGKVYSTLASQSLPPHFKWNDTPEVFADTDIYLSNFSHARHVDSEAVPFRSPANLLPPEVLSGAKAGSPVDIWMLGCAVYLLATGTPLFGDSYVLSPLTVVEETLPKLEELLTQNGKVSPTDILVFTTFLRACLISDPKNRATVADLLNNEWAEGGMICSCGW